MTIDEAIKVSEENKMLFELSGDTLAAKATQLGIEALKREQVWRQNDPGGVIHLLPGETED